MDGIFSLSEVKNEAIQRAEQFFAKDAGIRSITPHTLRHSFTKALIDVGTFLETVAILWGRNNMNTTRIYTTPGERDSENAVNMLEDFYIPIVGSKFLTNKSERR